ncbi:MAG: HAD family hydrolase, partial [Bacilli bacterium]
EALEKLKSYGYHLVVLTNKVHSATMLSLALMNIPTSLFDMIIGSDDMPFPKPDPSGMRIVMEKLHLQSNEVLYVGDNGVDFQFAENVGIDSMLVTWTLREIPQYAKPKYFVSSFDEIVEVLTNG